MHYFKHKHMIPIAEKNGRKHGMWPKDQTKQGWLQEGNLYCQSRTGPREWKSVGKGRSGYRGKIRKLIK